MKSVVLNGKKLKEGTGFTVKYKNNTKPGTATVTVTGKGNYKGSAKATFKIAKASKKSTTSSSVKAQSTQGSGLAAAKI